MPNVEIIAIWSELLLGETQDTNTFYLLRKLRDLGFDVFRTTLIGDNPKRIASTIQESLERSDIVITTGGLGPTVDDPTRDAVAMAFGCKTEFKEELWMDIRNYFDKMGRSVSENNIRQAYIPELAIAIPNPVGTAPAFYVYKDSKLVLSLPGVPAEMRYLIEHSGTDLLLKYFPTQDSILVKTLHTFGLGESVMDEFVGDLEKSSNPTLGLSAKQGIIDLRITAKGKTKAEAERLLNDFETEVRNRLGNNIFGVDDETLPEVVNRMITRNYVKLNVIEYGTGGAITKALLPSSIQTSSVHEMPDKYFSFRDHVQNIKSKMEIDSDSPLLICAIFPISDSFIRSEIYLRTNRKEEYAERNYNSLTFSVDQTVLSAFEMIRKAII